MRTTMTTVFGLLGLSSTVVADLYIFQVTATAMDEGGLEVGHPINIFSSPPSCNDVNNAINIFSVNNDASKGGFVCDGCNEGSILDWTITRFEMYDGPNAIGAATSSPVSLTTGAVGHITLRPNGDHYNLVWVSLDGNSQGIRGTCQRPAQAGREAQTFQCFQGIGGSSGIELFHCTTDLRSNAG
ncbi:hypothetical protein GP486_000699 [Trichoglossum hirsutum]|uniref:Uncharacterized protein n=1 Tax=Trichoglossum hirsutum TaxID=265104 RepID=A0A9P8LI24_9PEZI|nr:hypothetical protein GP486_000699 [Trichoglossum hirsutum]